MESPRFLDRRRSTRVRQTIPIRIRIASEDYQVEHEAFMMNKSQLGLRIRTAVPLSPGEAVVVALRTGSGHAIRAHVIWARHAKFSAVSVAGLETEAALG